GLLGGAAAYGAPVTQTRRQRERVRLTCRFAPRGACLAIHAGQPTGGPERRQPPQARDDAGAARGRWDRRRFQRRTRRASSSSAWPTTRARCPKPESLCALLGWVPTVWPLRNPSAMSTWRGKSAFGQG